MHKEPAVAKADNRHADIDDNLEHALCLVKGPYLPAHNLTVGNSRQAISP